MNDFKLAYLRSETLRITAQINGLKAALAQQSDFIPLAERAIQGDVSAQIALIDNHKRRLHEIEQLLLGLIKKAVELGVDHVVEFDPRFESCTKDKKPLEIEVRLYRTHAKHLPRAQGTVAVHEHRGSTVVRHIVELKPLFR